MRTGAYSILGVRVRLVNGGVPEALQGLPAQLCEEPSDTAVEGCSLDQIHAAGSGTALYGYDIGGSWLHRL